jgi:hypothetical protein
MRLGIGFLLAAFLGAGATALADDAISAIMATPAAYDGKGVTVTGTVSHIFAASTARAPYASFSLCDADSACVRIFVSSHPNITEGKTATASGSFRSAGSFNGRPYVNGIEADSVTSAKT